VVFHHLELFDQRLDGWTDIFDVGEADVAPEAIRAVGQARHVAEAGSGEFERQKIFGALLGDEAGETGGDKLRQVGEESHGAIVLAASLTKGRAPSDSRSLEKALTRSSERWSGVSGVRA